jgi:oligopeptide transport system permease protein
LRGWFGYDSLGRSLLARCLVGGSISLAVGLAAATVAVGLGVLVGLIAGYRGGWVDSLLMRIVDILYGLPYILLVILFKVALEQPLTKLRWGVIDMALLLILVCLVVTWALTQSRAGQIVWRIGVALAIAAVAVSFAFVFKGNPTDQAANLLVLFLAIGLVSWLTMARVIRGQVLSLRGQPFIEACKAMGLKQGRIFSRHILPNLIGPITVYATLTVPAAILYESFLSFLGIGVSPPLATWGSLASEGVEQLNPFKFYWWQLLFPCALLAITLLSLNFLGDGLRDVFDPKKEAAKI